MSKDSKFVFDAGAIALDLLNTRYLDKDQVLDLLRSPEDIVDWLIATGLPIEAALREPSFSTPSRRILFAETQWLRQDVLLIIETLVSEGRPPPYTVDALNRVLRESTYSFRLTSSTNSRLGEQSHDPLELNTDESASSVLGLLQPIALSAARLVTEANPMRIRQCASESCICWFLDTSKSGRRRWCSMARCGNRAKVAKHYRQEKPTG